VCEQGIVCGFHGWIFDTEGNCFSRWYNRFLRIPWGKAQAYPVQMYAGLYWAYLGPLPAPVLPRYDLLARQDGRRRITVHPNVEGNWLAAANHSYSIVFPTHLRSGSLLLRTPIDDAHTWQLAVDFIPSQDGTLSDPAVDEPEIVYPTDESWSPLPEAAGAGAESLRALLLREIERVYQGHDPLGTIRDPNHPIIDTRQDRAP